MAVLDASYLFDKDSGIWYSHDIGSCSLKSFGGRDVVDSGGGDIFISGLEVLSLDVAIGVDVECGFAEGAAVEIFWFDGGDVSCVSWYFSVGRLVV